MHNVVGRRAGPQSGPPEWAHNGLTRQPRTQRAPWAAPLMTVRQVKASGQNHSEIRGMPVWSDSVRHLYGLATLLGCATYCGTVYANRTIRPCVVVPCRMQHCIQRLSGDWHQSGLATWQCRTTYNGTLYDSRTFRPRGVVPCHTTT